MARDSATAGIGRQHFVADNGLYTEEQSAAASDVIRRIESEGLQTVRMVVVDQHGVPRAKFLSPRAATAAFDNGVDFSGAIYSLDTGNQVFTQAFAPDGGFGLAEFTGFPDIVIVPDPSTFQVLPWADRTGWILCDAYFSSGTPLPMDGRRLLRNQLERLERHGLNYLTGLEVEFYVTRFDRQALHHGDTTSPAATPSVEPFQLGYQYLSEVRLDSVNDTLMALRDGLNAIGLMPRSMEDEWGPGQMEFSLSPLPGLGTADAMVLFRSAVKQICARRGLLASFMCKPALPNFFANGWHLHSSLVDQQGVNAFQSQNEDIAPAGLNYIAGILDHAPAMAAFANPTVNGYSRFVPYSFAPDRIGWAVENRGVLVRVQGGPGDPGTHLENRLGEPAANPYLYLAADLAAGIEGIENDLIPPPPAASDPYALDSPMLPTSLSSALDALSSDSLYRTQFGDPFVDYYLMMKRFEIARHDEFVAGEKNPEEASAAWQMREYFEFY